MENYVRLLNGLSSRIVMDERTSKSIITNDDIDTYSFDDDNADYFSDVLHLSGEDRGVFSKRLHKMLGIFQN